MRALLIFLFAFAASAADSGLPAAAPEDVGMNQAVLRSGLSLFEGAVARDEMRGAVVLVARKGRVVLHEAVGLRDYEHKLPMERGTLFRMASNTKPVTATAILMLAEEGKLSVDDNVRKYLPSFDNYRAGSIKIRHLLSHTSGLRIPVIFFKPYVLPPALQTEVDRFGVVGAEETPGETYSYNNPGFNTLRRHRRSRLRPRTEGVLPRAYLRAARHEGELQPLNRMRRKTACRWCTASRRANPGRRSGGPAMSGLPSCAPQAA
ncbi:MAG: serine hydrolase domain-containing protein [Bryobacterales bacterium]